MKFEEFLEKYVLAISSDENTGVYQLAFSTGYGYSPSTQDNISIKLSQETFQYFSDIFDDAPILNINSVQLVNSHYYEVGLYQDSLERRKIPSSVRRKNGIEAHSIDRDRQHRIEYTIDQPSLAYIFSIYKTLEGIGDKSEIRRKLHLDRYDLFMIKMTPSGLDLIIRGYMQNVVDFKGSDESGAYRLESLSKEAFQSYVEEHQREILTSVFRAMLSPIKTLQIKRDATKMQADDRQLAASFSTCVVEVMHRFID